MKTHKGTLDLLREAGMIDNTKQNEYLKVIEEYEIKTAKKSGSLESLKWHLERLEKGGLVEKHKDAYRLKKRGKELVKSARAASNPK